MDPTKSMRRYEELIHELKRSEGGTNTFRFAGLGVPDRATPSRLKSSQTAPPQEPWANRHDNHSLVAAHPTSGGYPEGQQRREHRLVIILVMAIINFSYS